MKKLNWIQKIKKNKKAVEAENKVVEAHDDENVGDIDKVADSDIDSESDTRYQTRDITPYKTYRIGRFPKNSTDWKTIDPRKEGLLWFGHWKTVWSYQHPRLWKNLSSEEIVNDILGL